MCAVVCLKKCRRKYDAVSLKHGKEIAENSTHSTANKEKCGKQPKQIFSVIFIYFIFLCCVLFV